MFCDPWSGSSTPKHGGGAPSPTASSASSSSSSYFYSTMYALTTTLTNQKSSSSSTTTTSTPQHHDLIMNYQNNKKRKKRKLGVEQLIKRTLQKDFLFVKLQMLVDSKSNVEAEEIIKELDDALNERISDNDMEQEELYIELLLDLASVGTITILNDVLNRDDPYTRPSPLVVAPLIYRFAQYSIGYDLQQVTHDTDTKKRYCPNSMIVSCHRQQQKQVQHSSSSATTS